MGFAGTFFSIYPEFIDKVSADHVEAVEKRVLYLYAVLTDAEGKVLEIPAYMAVAHYIARSGAAGGDMGSAAGNPSGVLISASVGDVSVGLQSKPIKDMFEDFFATTPYGQEFLAWLATIGGITYVN